MKKTTKSIPDGHIAVVLNCINNHPQISYGRLKALISHEFETDDYFDIAVKFIEDNKFINRFGDTIRLLDSGEEWLIDKGSSLSVEDEELGTPEVLKHPYDVVKLKMEPKHVSVFQALRKIEKDEINLNPEFQRAFVWDNSKKSRLIESILIRIPLPAFYLDATNQTQWNVVDGLQRLSTLHHYCTKQSFALSDLQFLTELNGMKFEQLPPKYKVLIEDDTQLLFYNLMPGTPTEAKFTIFSRVNTGGMQLKPQEIRHALTQGQVTAFLSELSRSNEFVSATQGAVESLRMSDRELVLRALAFMSFGVEKYRDFNELDAFLVNAMSEFNRKPLIYLNDLKKEFYDSLNKVVAIFGRYAFRKFYEPFGRRSPLNKALFEIWVYCVRDYDISFLDENKDKIIEQFIKLVTVDEAFIKSVSASTGGYKAVTTRFSTISDMLKNIYNDK